MKRLLAISMAVLALSGRCWGEEKLGGGTGGQSGVLPAPIASGQMLGTDGTVAEWETLGGGNGNCFLQRNGAGSYSLQCPGFGAGGPGGGIPEPTTPGNFLRNNLGTWVPGLPLTGGVMTGPITLNADAVAGLQAVPLQQVQALIAAIPPPVIPPPANGSITDAMLANAYSGIGSCGNGEFVFALNRNAPPTCEPWEGGGPAVGPTPPTNPTAGDLWVNTSSSVPTLEVFDGTNWVVVSNPSPANTSPTPPANPIVGQIWYDSSVTPNEMKMWDGSAWVLVGGEWAPVTNPPGGVNNYAPINSPTFTGTPFAPAMQIANTLQAATVNAGTITVQTGGILMMAGSAALYFNGIPMGGTCAAGAGVTSISATGVPTCTAIVPPAGSITDAMLANAYSGIGACPAGDVVTALLRNAAPICSTLTDLGGPWLPINNPTYTGALTGPVQFLDGNAPSNWVQFGTASGSIGSANTGANLWLSAGQVWTTANGWQSLFANGTTSIFLGQNSFNFNINAPQAVGGTVTQVPMVTFSMAAATFDMPIVAPAQTTVGESTFFFGSPANPASAFTSGNQNNVWSAGGYVTANQWVANASTFLGINYSQAANGNLGGFAWYNNVGLTPGASFNPNIVAELEGIGNATTTFTVFNSNNGNAAQAAVQLNTGISQGGIGMQSATFTPQPYISPDSLVLFSNGANGIFINNYNTAATASVKIFGNDMMLGRFVSDGRITGLYLPGFGGVVANSGNTGLGIGDGFIGGGGYAQLNLTGAATSNGAVWTATGGAGGGMAILQIGGPSVYMGYHTALPEGSQFNAWVTLEQWTGSATFMGHIQNLKEFAKPSVSSGVLVRGSRDTGGWIKNINGSETTLTFAKEYDGQSNCTLTSVGKPMLWFEAEQTTKSVTFACVVPWTGEKCADNELVEYHCFGQGG